MLAEEHRRALNEFGQREQPFFFCIDYTGERMEIFSDSEAQNHGFRFSFPGREDEQRESEIALKVHPPDYTEYCREFFCVQKKIREGYSVLANLTCPVQIECNFNLEDIYLAAKAPFRVYKENEFVCFSPESFIFIQGNRIETRPMKGTRKVSKESSIAQVAQELLNDSKEKAEHYAVTDLLRNDLNKIARNVMVEQFRYLEILKKQDGFLLQTSSLISGTLPENWSALLGDIFFSLLPAGSITGAPKRETIRLLQICEPAPRGWYCGVAGYFDGSTLQSCVMIRFIEKKEEKYFFRSGGGITIDSEPHLEYRELLEKIYVPFS